MRFQYYVLAGLVALSATVRIQARAQDVKAKTNKPTIIFAKGPQDAKWTDDILQAGNPGELKKVADEHCCSVIQDQNDYYVIDESAYGIKRLRRLSAALDEISKNGTSLYVALDPSKYSADTFSYFLQNHAENAAFKNAYEKGSASLFFVPSLDVTLKANGRSVVVSNMPDAVKMNNPSLASTVDETATAKQRELPKRDKSLWEVGQGLKSIVVVFGGRERSLYNKAILAQKAIKLVSDELKALTLKYDEASINVANQLVQQFQDDIWGKSQANGATSGRFDELSSEMQRTFETQFAADYKAYGFGSESEALSFLRGSSVTGLHFDLGVSSLAGKELVSAIIRLRNK